MFQLTHFFSHVNFSFIFELAGHSTMILGWGETNESDNKHLPKLQFQTVSIRFGWDPNVESGLVWNRLPNQEVNSRK